MLPIINVYRYANIKAAVFPLFEFPESVSFAFGKMGRY